MLTTWLGWRSVFLVNVPAGVVAAVLSLRLVPRDTRRGWAGRGLDLPGAVLAVGGLLTLVFALAGAPARGWVSARTLALLAGSAVLLAAFAVAERLVRRPLLPPRIWRTRSLSAGVVLMSGATGILVGTFFLNTLYLQDLRSASPLRAGLEFLPLVAVTGLGAHLTTRLLPHAGTRALAVTGLALMGGGALWLSAAPPRPAT